jgi:GTP-binding protein
VKVADCKFYTGAERRSQFPTGDRPEIAFIGRSNVGKSSLINSLLGGPSNARVSKTPGRTQQVNFYLVDDSFFFVDLPGYGYARAPARVREKLAELIGLYLEGRERLATAVLLVDARHEPMEPDRAMGAWLKARKTPFELVLTKIDKLPRGRWKGTRDRATRDFGTDQALIYSSRTGEGRNNLWQTIHQRIALLKTGV